MSYFNVAESIYQQYQGRAEDVLSVIANRYIGENPKHPPVYRAFRTDGFLRDGDYQYIFDLERKLPELQDGQFVYTWAKLWSDEAVQLRFNISCFGPTVIYIDGVRVFKSNIGEDVFPDRRTTFHAEVKPGWNDIVIQWMKTPTGCGGRFGTGSIKGIPFHVVVPSAERDGQEGWIYTAPLDEPLSELPSENTSEAASGSVCWLPERTWSPHEQTMGQLARMFGTVAGRTALAWTGLRSQAPGKVSFTLQGQHTGDIELLLNGKSIFSSSGSGVMDVSVDLDFGQHELVVLSTCNASDAWGFSLQQLEPGLIFQQPKRVHGMNDSWFYAGPFDSDRSPLLQVQGVPSMERLFDNGFGGAYWRIDEPATVIRPYLENKLFGKWNYPLGVTLYGLLQMGLTLKQSHLTEYVHAHMELCTSHDHYALWDRGNYGGAGLNHQISAIDSLDDCGSFAAAMLEMMKHEELSGGRSAADRVADYITNVQDRLSDGALYRVRGSVDFMKDTLWCDDLYMSTPFLCRYAQLTGNSDYLNDAANQFLLYKKYLYMPEKQYMSHVYDFKFNRQTGVAWGRGNGWVLFSLTELLEVLPADHSRREELLTFFRELSEGYLRLQGKNGLWHQVLDVPESYEETSCTSMFLYAFARGVRYGWLLDPTPYTTAVMRAWEGMLRISIDKLGNVYGVCRGSGYSFSVQYYKDELSWNLNDTHGIGIVLLAGIEWVRMQQFLSQV
jgi:unsaturated rhamnogalacturonyl hydrolase